MVIFKSQVKRVLKFNEQAIHSSVRQMINVMASAISKHDNWVWLLPLIVGDAVVLFQIITYT